MLDLSFMIDGGPKPVRDTIYLRAVTKLAISFSNADLNHMFALLFV